ncbi:MAG: YjgP/YjgQ family permease [Flavobacteriaceae bacterium]|jgi:lipopolysaccharide export system permease protein|nr:YjgP/YjgQ family permease [Flavobacteriaceae bacterium]MBT6127792.1 YjgP/YjgQ family permease [Flavobacteriaceae bacterium]
MKIIDWYIIKKYLSTFVVMILLFIPIGVMVDMAEKIDKFKENEVPAEAILNYYLDFTWYFGNLLFPIFLFLAVIWFTSKLANNTEIIALLSSGISFSRFLRPYLISAGVIALFAFFSGMFIVPKSNSSFNEFHYKYINKKSERLTKNLFKQINPKEYIFVSSYDPIRKSANNFTLEHFEENQLTFKIQASSIRWVEKDSVFRLSAYSRRTFVDEREIYFRKSRLDTLFDFEIDDLAPVNYKAETLTFSPLNEFIEKEREGGSVMINSHLLVRHKRWTLPFSAFVLTLIGVSVSSFKRRGGMGVNLAFGISLGFLFIFFDKIFSVLVNKSNFSPLLGAWLPIIIFGGLAIFLLRRARR